MEDCGAGAAATAEAINWLGKKLVLDVDTWAKKKPSTRDTTVICARSGNGKGAGTGNCGRGSSVSCEVNAVPLKHIQVSIKVFAHAVEN